MQKFILPLCAVTFFAVATPAHAAGFYLQEQSVSGQGAAFAGAAANAQDASTIFYNPAGMTALGGATAQLDASVIIPRASYKDSGSTAGLNAGAQAAYTGNDGGNPFSPELVPGFYAASPMSENKKIWIGIGVSAPFGLSNKYDAGWTGRYDSTESVLKTVDVAPVMAFKIADGLSIGGGLNIQYAKAELSNALPCPAGFLGCGAAFSPTSDGASTLKGDNMDVGYNIGAMYQFGNTTNVGVHYRSAISHNIRGQASVTGLSGALAAFNGVRAASAELKLPETIGFGVTHDVNDRLKVMGSYNWFGWSKFDEIRVKFDNGDPDSTTPENYKDSYAVALGAEWKQTDAWTFRGGVQFDQTPTTDTDRSTRTPDGNRYWLSMGASYKLNSNMSFDAAASHIFMQDGDINLAKPLYTGTGAASTVNIRGASDNAIDIVSLQAVWKF